MQSAAMSDDPFQTQPQGVYTEQRVVDHAASPAERTYAMWIHLGGLIASFAAVATQGIGFWVPPVVVLTMWLIKRHESPFLDDHGREAMNFQISLLILFLIALVVGLMAFCVGVIFTTLAVYILGIIGMIMGSVAAGRGEFFRYPMCIRVL